MQFCSLRVKFNGWNYWRCHKSDINYRSVWPEKALTNSLKPIWYSKYTILIIIYNRETNKSQHVKESVSKNETKESQMVSHQVRQVDHPPQWTELSANHEVMAVLCPSPKGQHIWIYKLYKCFFSSAITGSCSMVAESKVLQFFSIAILAPKCEWPDFVNRFHFRSMTMSVYIYLRKFDCIITDI